MLLTSAGRHHLAIQKMAASVPLGVPVASSILLKLGNNCCFERCDLHIARVLATCSTMLLA